MNKKSAGDLFRNPEKALSEMSDEEKAELAKISRVINGQPFKEEADRAIGKDIPPIKKVRPENDVLDSDLTDGYSN